MKRMKLILITILGCLLMSTACQLEFTPELDLEEKTILYGLFNHHDSKHYVRISRSFVRQVSGDPLTAPTFHPDSLEVWLEVYRFNQRVGYPIVMVPELLTKEPGMFKRENQLVYSAEVKLIGDSECRILVLNKQSGESISSSCNLFSLQEFKPMFLSNMSRMEFYSLPDVYFYEVTCEFSYVEVTETDTSFQSLTYPVGIIFNGSKEPDLIMSISLNRPDWLNFLVQNIPVRPDVTRYALARPLEYKLLVGDQYLYDYRRSFSGKETVFHTGQSISNIQGGLGIFTAFDKLTLFSLPMLPHWYDKLANYPETKDLNFINYPWGWKN